MGIKKVFKLFALVFLVFFASFSSYIDSMNRHSPEHNDEIVISDTAPRAIIVKSIASSVRIISTTLSFDEPIVTSTSSGTYFEYADTQYIITTAHSLLGECLGTMVIADDYMFHCIDLILMDHNKDIAIFEVEDIFNRTPITSDDFIHKDKNISLNSGVHEKLIYTGYPQGLGPFTFNGNIVGHNISNGLFFAHSYAWAGSSGSGVFNSKGKMIGILTAVAIANTEHGVDVMEDLIIVTSLGLSDIEGIF